MSTKEKLHLYQDFVDSVISKDSTDIDEYIKRLEYLNSVGINMALMDTAATGMSSESGELLDIVKKLKFHGKEWDASTQEHLEKELGDVIFYWSTMCKALNVDPYSIIEKNITKLKNRYPEGFESKKSQFREKGDI